MGNSDVDVEGVDGNSPTWGQLQILLYTKFVIGLWESDKECFWLFEPFSKLKTTCYKHWTLIKIKIKMTLV